MQQIIEQARKKDKQGEYIFAYQLYLQAIAKNQAEMDDYLSVAMIAFLFQDCGFSSANHLPNSLIDSSFYEMSNILHKAKLKFGNHIAFDFWDKQFKLFFEDVDIDYKYYLNQNYLPALIGINLTDSNYKKEYLLLKKQVEKQENCFQRYIFSVMKFPTPPPLDKNL